MHGTVIILTVSTALLGIGFLASTTVLFTLCQSEDIRCLVVSEDSVENAELRDFSFPYGQSVGDSIVNGSSSKWMADNERQLQLFGATIVTGHLLCELDVPMGTVYLRAVDILSGGSQIDIVTINVNTGSSPFEVTNPNCANIAWVRTTNRQEDLDKIDCIIGSGYSSEWAFVATWIDFEGSTFQVVCTYDDTGSGMIIFDYGQLNQAHAGNKFAVVTAATEQVHPDAGSLPINKQLGWNIYAETKQDINTC